MIGLDTNVLVRYMTQDDPAQAAAATRLIEEQCTRDEPGFVDRVALCETIWVLESVYRYPKKQVAEAIEHLLRIDVFRVEDVDAAWCALRAWRTGKADFADHLIGEIDRRAGCTRTLTFDRTAASIPGFALLA